MRFSRPAQIILLFAIVAIALRALVPVGYMPDAHGKIFHVTICSMDGPKTIVMDAQNHPIKETPHVQKTCDFSLLSHTPGMAATMAVFAQHIHFKELIIAGRSAQETPLRQLRYTQAQPRGPPAAS